MTAIKPLMWTWYEDSISSYWEAKTPFGVISVYTAPAPALPTWGWLSVLYTTFGYQTAEAAMDAAAEWWEEAVLKCLDLHLQIGNAG